MEAAARKAIQQYLDKVNRSLSSLPDTQREETLRDIESHIYEALEVRTKGQEATLEDVNAVLANMDMPELYGQIDQYASPTFSVIYSIIGRVALGFTLGPLMLLAVTYVIPFLRPSFGVFFVFQLLAFALGRIARRDRNGKIAERLSFGLICICVAVFLIGAFKLPVGKWFYPVWRFFWRY